jgi:uncharacterized protein YndB with AHSA1/START domain
MKITIETTITASLDKVWAAWTTPDAIVRWNAASADWHTTKATVDLREGGIFSSRMEAKDGSMGFDFAGTYTKIIPHKFIDAQFGDRTMQVEFMPSGNAVLVRETFDAETQNSEDLQRQGWQAILDNFKSYVEAL